VAEYLHARGRRRAAIVTADDSRAGVRREGFVQVAARLGTPNVPVCVVPAPSALGHGRSGLADLLARQPGIDAVFCSSDVLALGAITEAQARGVPVPGRLAVVGFGDFGFAADTHPALTTVRIDGTAIGRQAARFIIDRVEGRPVAERVIDIGFSIVQRASA
jgi:LacI family gluconate utilization system Gnt-I transcriptional repressor